MRRREFLRGLLATATAAIVGPTIGSVGQLRGKVANPWRAVVDQLSPNYDRATSITVSDSAGETFTMVADGWVIHSGFTWETWKPSTDNDGPT